MLNRFYVNPILPAQDGNRARIFYRDVLSLDLLSGPAEDPMAFGAASGSSIVLRTCWESAHFGVPGSQGRRPGAAASRRAIRPIMAHLTIASAWAGSRS
jgi:hypothetical protein